MRNIFLIGPMGAGKTTLGNKLAYQLSYRFIDADDYITSKLGYSISEIFENFGEEYFRQQETICLQEMVDLPFSKIISTGGGVIVNSDNIQIMRKNGRVVYLSIDIETQYDRLLFDTKRPLVQTNNLLSRLTKLAEFRNPLYDKASHFKIQTNLYDINETLEIITSHLNK